MKILVAIDDSEAARKAVAFVGRTLGRSASGDLHVTLLHVVEALPEFLQPRGRTDEERTAYQKVSETWVRECREKGEQVLREQAQALEGSGIPGSCIAVKLCQREGLPESRRVLAALAIIDEMNAQNYDVVVVGRRSNSAANQSFLGGIAEKVAREAHGRTLWIVD
ncbi:MAG: universal stress protein [Planctomycetales bacterium]